MNYKRYKDAVVDFRKHLLWKEVAKKHILLYNSIIEHASSPLVRKFNRSIWLFGGCYNIVELATYDIESTLQLKFKDKL